MGFLQPYSLLMTIMHFTKRGIIYRIKDVSKDTKHDDNFLSCERDLGLTFTSLFNTVYEVGFYILIHRKGKETSC